MQGIQFVQKCPSAKYKLFFQIFFLLYAVSLLGVSDPGASQLPILCRS